MGPNIKDFGKLAKFDSSRNVIIIFKLAEELQKKDGVVRIAKLCRLAGKRSIDETVCRRIVDDLHRRKKLKLVKPGFLRLKS